jgi:hypothetical protein
MLYPLSSESFLVNSQIHRLMTTYSTADSNELGRIYFAEFLRSDYSQKCVQIIIADF